MHIIAKRPLTAFTKRHPDASSSLRAWWKMMTKKQYRSPGEVREDFATASFLGDELTVFNVAGNKYRLVVHIVYAMGRVFVSGVYTHAEYDRLTKAGLLG